MTAMTSLVMKTRLVTSWDKSQSPPPSFTTRKPVAATPTLRHAMSAVTAAAPCIAESSPAAAARYMQACGRHHDTPASTRRLTATPAQHHRNTFLLPQPIATLKPRCSTSTAQQVPQLQLHNHDSPRQPTQGAGPCNTTPTQQARATPQPQPTAHKPI
ncbi:hypothetical protein EDB89DRAFT_1902625 [Lactarius sanguifluus]|nr:hypothetical protein EDB89DRAFT_1902625 [Lactarius sanguifluus]